MARTDVFGTMSNEHRMMTIGGRKGCSRIVAHINSDTGWRSDVGLSVIGESYGERHARGAKRPHKNHECHVRGKVTWDTVVDENGRCQFCEQVRPGEDTRKTVFTVELPEPGIDVEIRLETHGYRMRELASLGALLVAVKGAQELSAGDAEHGQKCLEFSRETLEEMQRKAEEDVPHVTLPGGITLAHAMACVAMVKGILEGNAP